MNSKSRKQEYTARFSDTNLNKSIEINKENITNSKHGFDFGLKAEMYKTPQHIYDHNLSKRTNDDFTLYTNNSEKVLKDRDKHIVQLENLLNIVSNNFEKDEMAPDVVTLQYEIKNLMRSRNKLLNQLKHIQNEYLVSSTLYDEEIKNRDNQIETLTNLLEKHDSKNFNHKNTQTIKKKFDFRVTQSFNKKDRKKNFTQSDTKHIHILHHKRDKDLESFGPIKISFLPVLKYKNSTSIHARSLSNCSRRDKSLSFHNESRQLYDPINEFANSVNYGVSLPNYISRQKSNSIASTINFSNMTSADNNSLRSEDPFIDSRRHRYSFSTTMYKPKSTNNGSRYSICMDEIRRWLR